MRALAEDFSEKSQENDDVPPSLTCFDQQGGAEKGVVHSSFTEKGQPLSHPISGKPKLSRSRLGNNEEQNFPDMATYRNMVVGASSSSYQWSEDFRGGNWEAK